jgi:Leucine-rich repeat (LRR) protein
VPEFLGLFKKLRYLNLSSMPLFGRVPPQLGNLSNLHYLDLSPRAYNVPWSDPNLYSTDISWLSNLPLMYLDMDSVILNGTVDWAHVVNMIPSLKVLSLSNCWLTSANQSLPHLNLTDLVELSLSGNTFDHPIASCWFWNLTSLQHLELEYTSLYGQIPDALGGMMSLQALDFRFSYGGIDIMTANMTNLCKLERIDFSESYFYGNITDLFQILPQCSPNKPKELDLCFSNFSGVLPNWIGRWTTLRILDLSGNHLSGPVPYELGALNNLEYLDLSINNLDGLITQQHFAGLKKIEAY